MVELIEASDLDGLVRFVENLVAAESWDGVRELIDRCEEAVERGSERSFGLVFAAVFALVGLWPLTGSNPVRLWSLALAAVFVLLALAAPRCLAPLNRVWFAFGELLHRLVSPLVMGFIFFVVVTPIGLAMRVLGKDPLKLRLEAESESYWVRREPPGPPPDSMRNQF